MTKKLIIATFITTVLAGCSSAPRVPDYMCSLNVAEQGKCATVQESLKASQNMVPAEQRQGMKVQSVFEAQQQTGARNQAPAQAYYGGAAPVGHTESDPAGDGAPVFQQPNVMRVWVAPYVDADGVLRSGEYAYFTTPGKWNYGSLKKSGSASSASSMFEPTKPNQLGFTPDFKVQQAQQKRQESSILGDKSADAPPKPEKQSGADSAKVDSGNTPAVAGITQPYTRLNTK